MLILTWLWQDWKIKSIWLSQEEHFIKYSRENGKDSDHNLAKPLTWTVVEESWMIKITMTETVITTDQVNKLLQTNECQEITQLQSTFQLDRQIQHRDKLLDSHIGSPNSYYTTYPVCSTKITQKSTHRLSCHWLMNCSVCWILSCLFQMHIGEEVRGILLLLKLKVFILVEIWRVIPYKGCFTV